MGARVYGYEVAIAFGYEVWVPSIGAKNVLVSA